MSTENLPALTPEVVLPRPKPNTKAPKLSPQKRRFVVEYLASYNHKKALDAAGIARVDGCLSNDPAAMGPALLAQAAIQDYMHWMVTRDASDVPIARGRIRSEAAALAFANVGDAIELGEPDINGMRRFKSLRLDKIDGRIIAGVKVTTDKQGNQTLDLKLHPKSEMIRLLGDEQRMWGEDGNVTLPNVNIQINLTK